MCIFCLSNAEVGSSNNNIFGFCTMARIKQILWVSPPDKWWIFLSIKWWTWNLFNKSIAKSYGLFCDNKLVKGRCKGVRPRDTYLIGEYDDESHPFVADRDKVFVCDEEFYSSLCNGEKLSISCDVFKKGIGLDENGKKYFKLCHARMIKVI